MPNVQKTAMIRAVNQKAEADNKACRLFRSLFMPVYLTTDLVVVDYVDGKARAASPRPNIDDRNTGRVGEYNNQTYTPLEYSEEIPLQRRRLALQREMGQPEDMSGAVNYMTEAASNIVADVRRGIELACARATIDAAFTEAQAVNQTAIDYARNSDNLVTLTGTSRWSESGSDPINDVYSLCNTILKNSGNASVPARMIMGDDALNAFLKHDDVKEVMYKGFRLPDSVAERDYRVESETGATYHGRISCGNFNLSIYGYSPYCKEDADTDSKPFLPHDKVIILPNRPIGTLCYAGIPVIDASFTEGILNMTAMDRGISLIRGEYALQATADAARTSIMLIAESRVIPVSPPPLINSVGILDVIST